MKNTLLSLCGLTVALSLQPALADDGLALFQSKSCVACHAVDAKLVGPALKEVAIKHVGIEGAAQTLASHIKDGTQGNWGPIPMPANAVTDDEATQLANWILSLK